MDQSPVTREEAYAVSMQNDQQLATYFWCRNLKYEEYVAFVTKHHRKAMTLIEYIGFCALCDDQMMHYFSEQG